MKKILPAFALLFFLENLIFGEEKNININYNLSTFFGLKQGNAIISINKEKSSCNINISDFCLNYYYIKKDNTNILNQDVDGINELYVWVDSGAITYISTKNNIKNEHSINNDANASDFLSIFEEFCEDKNKNEFKVLNSGKIYSLNVTSSSTKGYNLEMDVSKLEISGIKHIYLKTKNVGLNGRTITGAKIERSFYNSIDAKLKE